MSHSPKHSSTVFQNANCTFEDNANNLRFSKNQIIKNFLIISSAWWIFFSAYDCLVMLQSTLNSEKGIGVVSIAVQYGGGIFVSLLFPKYCLKKLGCKRTFILCIIFHLPYITANFFPHWIFMILTSTIVSVGNPLLWAALCSYLNYLSILYADIIQNMPDHTATNYDDKYTYKNDEDNFYIRQYAENSNDILKFQNTELNPSIKNEEYSAVNVTVSKTILSIEDRSGEILSNYHSSTLLDGVTARFFGIHAMIYHTCHVIGSIVTYYILKDGTEGGSNANSTCICGADFCNDQSECFEGNLKVPDNEIRYTLTAICLAFAGISVIIIALYLDELKEREKNVSLSLNHLMASLKILKSWNFVCLIPLTVYIGVLHGFVMGDYTQAFIGCAWGIHNIALVLTMFGITLALSSSICGWFVKYLGRLPIFLFTATLNAITGLLLLFWEPDGGKPAMMFVVGGFLGFVIGTYWSQSRAFYGILFKDDEEAVFGSYQIWFCVGASLGFGYSNYLCTSLKIYLILIYSTVAILGYLKVEISYLKCKQRNK